MLNNKHIVIIGGSSGIGLETARIVLTQGGKVTIASRSEEKLKKAKKGSRAFRQKKRWQEVFPATSLRWLKQEWTVFLFLAI